MYEKVVEMWKCPKHRMSFALIGQRRESYVYRISRKFIYFLYLICHNKDLGLAYGMREIFFSQELSRRSFIKMRSHPVR